MAFLPMTTVLPTLDAAAWRRSLLRWFAAHQRDLPWRRTRDPYAIWVAEVMLQQTRVAAVLEHYREFLRRFPTVEALARARPSQVLAAWSGLGYYRRARALHAAAKLLVRDLRGRLPEDEHELARLPGIGRYTAAAIASTAFGRRCAVVDGNVERVLTCALGTRLSCAQLWSAAERLLSPRHSGDFNQAMMELGATVCLPATPNCQACPLRRWCTTSKSTAETQRRRGHEKKRHKKDVACTLATGARGVFLVQRDAGAALMPRMWELPPAGAAGNAGMVLRHAITDTDYRVTVVRGAAPAGANGRWIRLSRLRALPLTGLARKILRRAGII
jgi:A/G-specific adenine glycosylase